jgi:hypothetical protein
MSVASRDRALAKIQEALELLLASPEEQESWANASNMPAVEIALQYYDAVPTLLYGLRDRALINEDDERAFRSLHEYLISVQSDLFRDGPYVSRTSEWERVRELARTALKVVQ